MPSDVLKNLNPAQIKAVTHNSGPLLILAGAGSGKTRCLTHRAAHLIQKQSLPAHRILMITFTNKAANEMKERIQKLIGQNIPWASTFHSFAARLLRLHANEINLPPNYTIYDQSDSLNLIKQIIKKNNLDPKKIKPKSILASISNAKSNLIDENDYSQHAHTPFQKTVAQIYQTYQKLLINSSALDFNDLLFKAVLLLQQSPETLNLYQEQFAQVLIDEYQDTNYAQYQLAMQLTRKKQNLSAVGDCSQSIYSWRGADYHNILNLKKDFPNITIINLEQNYRSTKNILLAANAIIQKNQTHPILKLWTNNNKGKKIQLRQAIDEKHEAMIVSSNILTSDYQPNEHAVLYRTNAQSRTIEEALIRSGIPYKIIGGINFYERKEIKDILAYARLIANPNDQISLERAQKIGIRRFRKFTNIQQQLNPHQPTPEIIQSILQSTNYLDQFDRSNPSHLSKIENIKELLSVAILFPDINQFLENIALVQNEYLPNKISDPSPNNHVTLMTLHAAKGLEFTCVYLIGLEEGLFPHSRVFNNPEELEEERRLCYVGITRAKKELMLIYTKKRLYFGKKNNSIPSRFISEIPPELIST